MTGSDINISNIHLNVFKHVFILWLKSTTIQEDNVHLCAHSLALDLISSCGHSVLSAEWCSNCSSFLLQGCICGFAIATGAASRLISGYDSYGNICGRKNSPIEGIDLSGRDQTENKLVFLITDGLKMWHFTRYYHEVLHLS